MPMTVALFSVDSRLLEGVVGTLFLVFCPLVISLVLTGVLIRLAPKLGLVDYPDPRKVHTKPTPRGGGLAIGVAVGLTALLLVAEGWAARIGLPPRRESRS